MLIRGLRPSQPFPWLLRAPRRTVLNLRIPHLGLLRRLIVLAALAVAAAPAHASLMLPPPPIRPKDFAVVKKDGLFHIFYIRHDNTKVFLETERDFGHAVSADMYSWTQLPAVMSVRDSSWDNQHVWAPSIVELDSVYYMFYTGVTGIPGDPVAEQRIGLATSTDLMTWNRLDQPLLSCRDVPWGWCGHSYLNGFRDPFVMPDPALPGHWLMYYAAAPAADSAGMVVSVAASDGDLSRWTDLMPLWITDQPYSPGTIDESPHLFKHGNQWFMFVTKNLTQLITYFVTPNPTGPLEQWSYRGSLSAMLGIDTNQWYASEYFADGTNDYFAFVQYNRVEMYKMFWTGPETFRLFEPGNFHVQSLTWSADSVTKGGNATLSVVATGWAGRELELAAAEKLPDGSEAPIAIESLQIPALLPLTADTTRFVWTSTILHASGDTTAVQTVVVRAADLTAGARPITVRPPQPPPPPPTFAVRSMAWSADSVRTGQSVTLSVVAENWSGHSVALEGVERLPGGGEAPINLAQMGLPASLALVADTTRLSWTASIRRPSDDTTRTLVLEVRTADHAVVAPGLRISPSPAPPPPFEIIGIGWGADSVRVGDPMTVTVVAVSWSGQVARLTAIERLPRGAELALNSDSMGLPAAMPLVADTTRFAWTARIHRDTGDTASTMRLVLQNPDFETESPMLQITQPPPQPAFVVLGIRWSADSAEAGHPVTLSVIASGWEGHALALEAVERLPGGGEDPVAITSLGLPATLALTADTTRLEWITRIHRNSGDTTVAQDLVVRAPGAGVESPALRITPVPPGSPPLVVRGIRWSTDSVEAGKPVTLSVIASGWVGRALALEAVERLPGGGEGPLAIASLGLPATLALTADTTRLVWITRIHRASGDTTVAQDLVVRAAGAGTESPSLRITPPPAPPLASTGGESDPPPTQDRRLMFRPLRRSVLGEEPTFLVDLPNPARARLEIYDLQGRRVRMVADRDLAAGANVLAWDGRDANGMALGRGLYFARISTPFASRTVKVVITRPAGAP
jgi:hypothetical protein